MAGSGVRAATGFYHVTYYDHTRNRTRCYCVGTWQQVVDWLDRRADCWDPEIVQLAADVIKVSPSEAPIQVFNCTGAN